MYLEEQGVPNSLPIKPRPLNYVIPHLMRNLYGINQQIPEQVRDNGKEDRDDDGEVWEEGIEEYGVSSHFYVIQCPTRNLWGMNQQILKQVQDDEQEILKPKIHSKRPGICSSMIE